MPNVNTHDNNWFHSLEEKIFQISKSFNLTDKQTYEMRDFIFQVCRENYKTGTRVGVKWAFEQTKKNDLTLL